MRCFSCSDSDLFIPNYLCKVRSFFDGMVIILFTVILKIGRWIHPHGEVFAPVEQRIIL